MAYASRRPDSDHHVREGVGAARRAREGRRRAGDVVWIPAGVKHWHGATATDAMAHIALSYTRDGTNVTWMEQVSDEQYAQ